MNSGETEPVNVFIFNQFDYQHSWVRSQTLEGMPSRGYPVQRSGVSSIDASVLPDTSIVESLIFTLPMFMIGLR